MCVVCVHADRPLRGGSGGGAATDARPPLSGVCEFRFLPNNGGGDYDSQGARRAQKGTGDRSIRLQHLRADEWVCVITCSLTLVLLRLMLLLFAIAFYMYDVTKRAIN